MIQYKDPGIQSQGEAGPPARLDNSAISRRLIVRNRARQGVEVKLKSGAMELKKIGCLPVEGVKSVRGPCKGFSIRSRRRMMDRLTGLDWAVVAEKNKKARYGKGFFVTLTYGEDWGDKDKIKRDLEAWKKRVRRALGPFSASWKMELQERGVPHYHVTLFFKSKMKWSDVAQACRESWVGLVDSKVVDVQTIYAKNGEYGRLMRYMTKYMGKPWESNDEWGRVWGIWYEEELPIGVVYSGELSHRGYIELCRRLRRWGRGSKYLRKSSSNRTGMLIYGSQSQMVQLLRGLDFVYGGQHEEGHDKSREIKYAM